MNSKKQINKTKDSYKKASSTTINSSNKSTKNYALDHIKNTLSTSRHNIYVLIKWLILATIVGIVVGAIVTFFKTLINKVTEVHTDNIWLLFLLPIAGILIVLSYHILGLKEDPGIHLVMSSVKFREQVKDEIDDDDEKIVPFRMTPLIILATTLTHICGGSAGRTGAALQIGGSISSGLASLIKLDKHDRKIFVMSGISAGFAAIFGTPMAASIFALEVVSVGNMMYTALVPCIFSALIAANYASSLGILPESFNVLKYADFNLINILKIVVLAITCALVSMLFCTALHIIPKIYQRYFKNPYIRILVGALIVVIINLLLPTNDFRGLGRGLIVQAIKGDVVPYAFIIKLLLTALTIGCGFKGGEIMPSLVIGATLGCTIGTVLGISPSMCAALGIAGLFCGATNCPITSILLALELFGYKGIPFILIVISISYMMSGYNSLYKEQIIIHNKLNDIIEHP